MATGGRRQASPNMAFTLVVLFHFDKAGYVASGCHETSTAHEVTTMTMMSDPSRMIGQRAIVTTNKTRIEGVISFAGLGGVIVHTDDESRLIAAGEVDSIETCASEQRLVSRGHAHPAGVTEASS